MRKPILCTMILLGIWCLATSTANAQQTFEYSTVVYDDSMGAVYGNSVTEIDYNSDYYYDAYVESYLYENGILVDSNYAESPTGTASALTAAWADPNSEYTETGYHDLYVRFGNEDKYPEGCRPCDGCNTECYYDNWYYYDAYGFSFVNTGSYGPWFDLFGEGPAIYLENNEEEYLGETSASLTLLAVRFSDASLVDTNRSAEFDGFNVANLNMSTETGPNACGGDNFVVKVRFHLPDYSASCCNNPTTTFVKLAGSSKFHFVGDGFVFYGNDTPAYVLVYLKRNLDGSGSANSVQISVGGAYQSGESYRGQGTVHLVCP